VDDGGKPRLAARKCFHEEPQRGPAHRGVYMVTLDAPLDAPHTTNMTDVANSVSLASADRMLDTARTDPPFQRLAAALAFNNCPANDVSCLQDGVHLGC
jgi:hypothetical protein